MITHDRLNKNKGFSLIEVVIGLSIICVGLISVLALMNGTINAQYKNKNVLIASQLAQEGIEIVRNKRDENWLNEPNPFDQDITGTYAADYRGIPAGKIAVADINDANARLRLNNQGLYTFDNSATNTTIFSRILEVNTASGSSSVKCTVSWNEKGGSNVFIVQDYLYDWH